MGMTPKKLAPTGDFVGSVRCPSCAEKGEDRRGNNLATYSSGTGYCHKCGTYYPDVTNLNPTLVKKEITKVVTTPTKFDYDPKEVKACRGITKSTFEKYGVMVTDTLHVYPYFDNEKNLVDCQNRRVEDKTFYFQGQHTGASELLWGAHLFPRGSAKNIVLTEGQLDACSAYQMLSGRYPVVSLPNGAKNIRKVMQKNFEYLDSFETVYLSGDMDKPGRECVEAIAKMFKPGKVRIVELPCKDANDVLFQLDEPSLYQRCINNAKVWAPSGIVYGSTLLESILNRMDTPSIPFPWAGLNDALLGIRPHELTTLCAGTGQGKSLILRELAYFIWKSTKDKIGMLFLEEDKGKTGAGLLSIHMNKPLIISSKVLSDEEKERRIADITKADAELFKGAEERFVFYDHSYQDTLDQSIIDRVRYMATVENCKYIFLDHLSILVSAQEGGDERKNIDSMMHKMHQLVMETGIHLFVNSHLKRSDGEAHEEGGEISLNTLRGSQSIAQLSDNVIALERNQQDQSQDKRNTTLIRVLKGREFGTTTGPATALKYSRVTGRLNEVDMEEYYNDAEDETKENPMEAKIRKIP